MAVASQIASQTLPDFSAELAQRRQKFGAKVGDGIAIFASAPTAINHNDVEYLYRQDSDFYYLTGFAEPEAIAVFIPNHAEHRFILFVRPRDPEAETWSGLRAGVEGAVADYGADVAYPIAEFSEKVLPYLKTANTLHYSFGINRSVNEQILSLYRKILASYPKRGTGITAIADAKILLAPLRLHKTAWEISKIKKAIAISAESHQKIRANCKPGIYEYELAAQLELDFRRTGGMGCAYPSIVAAGANACVLHYVENNSQIQAGNLVLVDAGCCYDYYNADITRTFPASGKFSSEQKAIYELVLNAQLAAIAQVKPGNPYNAPHLAAVEVIISGLHDLGLIQGNLSELLANGLADISGDTEEDQKKEKAKIHKPFFMHGTGHYLGMDVHDVGGYRFGDRWGKLEPGMVITIEPGIYISPAIKAQEGQSEVSDRWKGIGVRIEDDLLVTENGHEVLTQAVPKQISDLEYA